jgi:BirA family biotin operon repressor/biotin-[acetyl-CoA-carboxylase] ligase
MSFSAPETIPIFWHRELPSTNTAALDRIVRGEVAAAWLAAERQTAGRGRSGRPWSDPPGNLAATLIVPLTGPAEVRAQLSFVAGVALVRAVEEVAAQSIPRLHLKWPNDLLIAGAKCAGILVESTTDPSGHAAAAIGFGVNLKHAPEIDGRATTALASHGVAIGPQEFLALLSRSAMAALAVWDQGDGFAAIRSEWMRHAVPEGTELTVSDGATKVTGRYAGIDQDGALRLQLPDDTVRRLIAGDVELAAPPQ